MTEEAVKQEGFVEKAKAFLATIPYNKISVKDILNYNLYGVDINPIQSYRIGCFTYSIWFT